MDKICSAVENNRQTVGIILDLSKAFDAIDHETLVILLCKLMHYGFRRPVLDWFNSYFSNKTHYVYYKKL